jgi:hypothetical protein
MTAAACLFPVFFTGARSLGVDAGTSLESAQVVAFERRV